VLLVSAVVAVAVSTIGSGALGGQPVEQAAGGALSATSTLVAPAGPAFSIWGVIYTGLVALAVWQLAAARPDDPRQRAAGWWLVASAVLNALWITVVQLGSLVGSVVVIAALAAVLGVALARLGRTPPRTRVEALLVDGTTGLYLGWVLIATVANVSAWLKADVLPTPVPGGESLWAVLVLVVAAAIGVGIATLTGRLAPTLSLAWGLAWVAVGRTDPSDTTGPVPVVVVVAAAAALVVLAAGVRAAVLRHRSTRDVDRARSRVS
jgi:hypothetical protein